MNYYMIKEMANDVCTKLGIVGDKEQVVLDAIKHYWSDCVADVWTDEDVLTEAKRGGISITPEDAHKILLAIMDNYDSDQGVNWSVIREYLKQYAQSTRQKPNEE